MTTDAPPSALTARGLTKVFRDFWGRPKVRAVDGIDLDVRRGEIFGLLGPNGSGKSTTLKMILGLIFPTAGELTVLGQSPRDVATKARLGFMPEESYLYRYLTPEEILSFYARLHGMAGLPARQRVDELIDQAGLSAARRRRIGEFSKGMARRVGLAQALLNDPDLVLLDEPTSGLDPIAGRQVKDLLLALARRGKTVLVCSHHLADMQDVCSRVAILIDGRICAHGPVPDLLRQSDTLRLTLPAMPPEKLAAVLGFIERETGAAPRVDQAERTLEALFVEVVTHRPPAP